jgi:hypothetical protein
MSPEKSETYEAQNMRAMTFEIIIPQCRMSLE